MGAIERGDDQQRLLQEQQERRAEEAQQRAQEKAQENARRKSSEQPSYVVTQSDQPFKIDQNELDATYRLVIDDAAQLEINNIPEGLEINIDANTTLSLLNDGSIYLDDVLQGVKTLEELLGLSGDDAELVSEEFAFEIQFNNPAGLPLTVDGFDPLAPFIISEAYGAPYDQGDLMNAMVTDFVTRSAEMLGDINPDNPDWHKVQDTELVKILRDSFGENVVYDENGLTPEAKDLITDVLAQDDSWVPEVQFESAQTLQNNNAAFGLIEGEPVIFLNEDAPVAVSRQALVEEIGHALEQRLGVKDAKGDEGQLFEAAFSGELYDENGEVIAKVRDAAIRDTQDHGRIIMGVDTINVEFSKGSTVNPTNSQGLNAQPPSMADPFFNPAAREHKNIPTEADIKAAYGQPTGTTRKYIDDGGIERQVAFQQKPGGETGEGLYTFVNQNGLVKITAEGVLSEDGKEFEGNLYHKNGSVSVGKTENGKREGLFKSYDNDGNIISLGHYYKDKPVGSYTLWDDGGGKETITYNEKGIPLPGSDNSVYESATGMRLEGIKTIQDSDNSKTIWDGPAKLTYGPEGSEDVYYLEFTDGKVTKQTLVDGSPGLLKTQAVMNMKTIHPGGFRGQGVQFLLEGMRPNERAGRDAVYDTVLSTLEDRFHNIEVLSDPQLKQIAEDSWDKPYMLEGGFNGHAMGILVYKGEVIITNKGTGANKGSEAHRVNAVTHLQTSWPLSELQSIDENQVETFKGSLIKPLLEKLRDAAGMNETKALEIYNTLGNEDDPTFNKLSPIEGGQGLLQEFDRVYQRTGNCYYASPQTAAHALMYVLADEELSKTASYSEGDRAHQKQLLDDRVNPIYNSTISGKHMRETTLPAYIKAKAGIAQEKGGPPYNPYSDHLIMGQFEQRLTLRNFRAGFRQFRQNQKALPVQLSEVQKKRMDLIDQMIKDNIISTKYERPDFNKLDDKAAYAAQTIRMVGAPSTGTNSTAAKNIGTIFEQDEAGNIVSQSEYDQDGNLLSKADFAEGSTPTWTNYENGQPTDQTAFDPITGAPLRRTDYTYNGTERTETVTELSGGVNPAEAQNGIVEVKNAQGELVGLKLPGEPDTVLEIGKTVDGKTEVTFENLDLESMSSEDINNFQRLTGHYRALPGYLEQFGAINLPGEAAVFLEMVDMAEMLGMDAASLIDANNGLNATTVVTDPLMIKADAYHSWLDNPKLAEHFGENKIMRLKNSVQTAVDANRQLPLIGAMGQFKSLVVSDLDEGQDILQTFKFLTTEVGGSLMGRDANLVDWQQAEMDLKRLASSTADELAEGVAALANAGTSLKKVGKLLGPAAAAVAFAVDLFMGIDKTRKTEGDALDKAQAFLGTLGGPGGAITSAMLEHRNDASAGQVGLAFVGGFLGMWDAELGFVYPFYDTIQQGLAQERVGNFYDSVTDHGVVDFVYDDEVERVRQDLQENYGYYEYKFGENTEYPDEPDALPMARRMVQGQVWEQLEQDPNWPYERAHGVNGEFKGVVSPNGKTIRLWEWYDDSRPTLTVRYDDKNDVRSAADILMTVNGKEVRYLGDIPAPPPPPVDKTPEVEEYQDGVVNWSFGQGLWWG